MSPEQTPPSTTEPTRSLFGSAAPAPASSSPLPWLVAAGVVVLAVAVLLLAGRHSKQGAPAANVALPDAAYASQLSFSTPVMSESSSLSGGKSTYIDGQVRNAGGQTLTSATVQVVFGNDENMPPQIETVPLTLVRTREPYVDTQPLSAAPLAPGEEREYRLIFENIGSNWNQQLPQIHVVQAGLR